MRLALACVLLLAASPVADAGTISRVPVEDLGLPFWCDWGYDWDERCYRDNTARLPVGGVDDKVWRAALRFSLDGLPPGASVASARFELYFDGTCVAPRRRAGPCLEAEYAVDAHAILSPSWTMEREVEFDPANVAEFVVASSAAAWAFWDVTVMARGWSSGALANRGLLLKLSDDQEGYGVSGPYFPSASFAVPSLRPRLVISYTVPATGLSP